DVLKQLPEKNRYIRGLVSWIGFRQTYVEYVREERFAGETKYPLKKMLRFAWDGITSFSRVPLIISTGIGMVLSIISTVTFLAILVRQVVGIQPYPWWVYLILLNLLCLGFLFIVLGIMGEYIGRIYDETKNRPLYIVSEKAGFHNEQEPNELHR
ncbi:MAG: glycosyltransferase, partial [Atribacterota bacterium]